jgi:HD superfamily phosphohydrolase
MSIFLRLFIIQIFIISSLVCSIETPIMVETIYGTFEVTESVLIDLFGSSTMERTKHVHQYGAADYVIPQNKNYCRYEHCVGVWALLRKYGATLEEQIAGLLHDASHTVFSHVGDILFDHHSMHSSYQDDIHEWYLLQQKIDVLLERHHISLDAVLHKSGKHKMLEQDLPDICADRLEYNLQAGLLTNLLTLDDVIIILDNLHYCDGMWFFTDMENAKKLALVSLFNTEYVWGGPEDYFIGNNMACALRRALEIGLIKSEDVHFSTDDVVWDLLCSSNDSEIISCMNNIRCYKDIVIITEYDAGDFVITSKFRGLNPFVQTEKGLIRLTELDDEYKQEYERVQNLVTQGWGVCLHA